MGTVYENLVVVMGYAVANPNKGVTHEGKAWASLVIALRHKYRSKGKLKEHTDMVRVKFWGKDAETIGAHMEKGRPIYIRGKIVTDDWEDRSVDPPRKFNRMGIEATSFTMLGNPKGTPPLPPVDVSSDDIPTI